MLETFFFFFFGETFEEQTLLLLKKKKKKKWFCKWEVANCCVTKPENKFFYDVTHAVFWHLVILHSTSQQAFICSQIVVNSECFRNLMH